MQYLKSQGVRLPQQCAVTGIGNNQLAAVVEPALTTVEYFYEEVGARAARLLFDAIQQGERPQGVYFVEYRLIERDSA